jgi:hypothetical protein
MPRKSFARAAGEERRPAYDRIKDEAEYRGHYSTRPAEAVNRTGLERQKTGDQPNKR